MATQIRLVISPDQIKSVLAALDSVGEELDPHAMHFRLYLKKKEMELALGMVTAAYTKKKSTADSSSFIPEAKQATIITPENVFTYATRIANGEEIILSPIDKAEIKSFAEIMNIPLPLTF